MTESITEKPRTIPSHSRALHGGTQDVYRFANGYGASVIRHESSYGGRNGLFELAVIRFTRRGQNDWDITYSTPISEDVIGHLSAAEVEDLLVRIQELEAAK